MLFFSSSRFDHFTLHLILVSFCEFSLAETCLHILNSKNRFLSWLKIFKIWCAIPNCDKRDYIWLNLLEIVYKNSLWQVKMQNMDSGVKDFCSFNKPENTYRFLNRINCFTCGDRFCTLWADLIRLWR